MATLVDGLRGRILEYIMASVEEQGCPPTLREIGRRCGIASTGSVEFHLAALERAGMISRRCGTARGISVAEHLTGIPILGRVAAGMPLTAIENIEGYVQPSTLMIGKKGMFALRVHGESMINAGILEGDIVIVREQSTASNGDIVVAMIDDEATVKYFYHEHDHIRLQPANDRFQPIRTTAATVLGRVVKVIRNYS